MKKISVIYFTVSFIFCQVSTQNQLSINFWTGLSEPEKISFVNAFILFEDRIVKELI